jgi:hypothetical protein
MTTKNTNPEEVVSVCFRGEWMEMTHSELKEFEKRRHAEKMCVAECFESTEEFDRFWSDVNEG